MLYQLSYSRVAAYFKADPLAGQASLVRRDDVVGRSAGRSRWIHGVGLDGARSTIRAGRRQRREVETRSIACYWVSWVLNLEQEVRAAQNC